MSSNRFANTLRSVRQHNYRNDDDNTYEGPFRDNSSSKVYFSIKPSDQINKPNPLTTSRATRNRTHSGANAMHSNHSAANRYGNGLKMSDRKTSYHFKNIERPSYTGRDNSYTRENYTGLSSNSYRPSGLTDRVPTFFDNSEMNKSGNSQFISRSKSAIKNMPSFELDRFNNTLRMTGRDESTYSASRRTLYSNTGRMDYKFSGIKYEDDDGRSPYKRYVQGNGQYDNTTSRSRRGNENLYNKFYYPSFMINRGKSNSSMISSKSYEIGDQMGKENNNNLNQIPSSTKRSMIHINKMSNNQPLTTRESLIPGMDATTSRKSNNLFFDFTQKNTHTQANNDSYIFKPNYEGSSYITTTQDGRKYYNHSPTISARRDMSRVSALDRSDLSMRSRISNNNSCITRREGSGGPSRIRGVPCESRLKNMSKTWVRSNLLESREDISTLSKNLNFEKNLLSF